MSRSPISLCAGEAPTVYKIPEKSRRFFLRRALFSLALLLGLRFPRPRPALDFDALEVLRRAASRYARCGFPRETAIAVPMSLWRTLSDDTP